MPGDFPSEEELKQQQQQQQQNESIIQLDIRSLIKEARMGGEEVSLFPPIDPQEAYDFFISSAAVVKQGSVSNEERGLIVGLIRTLIDVSDSTSNMVLKRPISTYLELATGELAKHIEAAETAEAPPETFER